MPKNAGKIIPWNFAIIGDKIKIEVFTRDAKIKLQYEKR
jgi:hypothetical protein